MRGAENERGAVLVLVAATMAALAVLTALIIDMGGARRDRDADQLAADSMALAGASDLTGSMLTAEAACQAAWAYLTVNLSDAVNRPPANCATFAAVCDPAIPRQVSVAVPPFEIALVHPVPDGHALLGGQPADAVDGRPCQRFGVEVRHERPNLAARGSVELTTRAVARLVPGRGDVQAPLVLLEPSACDVLTLNGNGSLVVNTAGGQPGYIHVDSDGSACGDKKGVVLDTVGDSTIRAGAITMWALNGPNAHKAFDPADTDLFDLQNPKITPTPTASSATVGRSGMDWQYNCKPSNGCPEEDRPPYVDELVATHRPDPPNPNPPAGYQRWTTHSGHGCSLSSHVAVPAGNWWIDCPSGLSTNRMLTFQGGNILADRAITVTGSGALRINCASSATASCPTSNAAAPSIYYVRSGSLTRNSDLEMYETFVYLQAGTVDLGGNGRLVWTAPDDESHPFHNLALWTDQTSPIQLRGTSDMQLEGILFAPNARVEMVGNTGATALGAQIFARSLDMAGNTSMTLAPRSDRILTIGRGQALLIR